MCNRDACFRSPYGADAYPCRMSAHEDEPGASSLCWRKIALFCGCQPLFDIKVSLCMFL